ncbi:putative hydrolase C777.06c [Brassica napus]|uniref:putative hydrolase C777.06c n=1 Tax=Brassica napus TaxID=3708 RepID=UPI00207A1CCC|nr:putative hydrolase C777.06c [Brassica napus]
MLRLHHRETILRLCLWVLEQVKGSLTNPLKTCSVCTKSNRTWKQEQETLTPAFLFGTLDHPEQSNILIGCGNLRTLDAVVITHSHADAIGGPDDLRDWTNNVQPHIPIYTATRDFEVMKKTHYYLVDTSVHSTQHMLLIASILFFFFFFLCYNSKIFSKQKCKTH